MVIAGELFSVLGHGRICVTDYGLNDADVFLDRPFYLVFVGAHAELLKYLIELMSVGSESRTHAD